MGRSERALHSPEGMRTLRRHLPLPATALALALVSAPLLSCASAPPPSGPASEPTGTPAPASCSGIGCLLQVLQSVLGDVLGGSGPTTPGGGPDSDPDQVPGQQGPSGQGITFQRDGVFHAPTPQHPVERVVMRPKPGTYRVLRAQLDIYHGGWSQTRPSGAHSLFWLVRKRNKDMFGYAAVRNKSQLFLRHGFALAQGDKPKLTTRVHLQKGTWYHFDYLYDTGARTLRLTVSTGNREIARLNGRPNIQRIQIGSNQPLYMDFGFREGDNPQEPPTYGWKYANLRVTLEP